VHEVEFGVHEGPESVKFDDEDVTERRTHPPLARKPRLEDPEIFPVKTRVVDGVIVGKLLGL
jgi:hypothetical protein